MRDIAITVKNISKQYRIGPGGFVYYNLRDRLAGILKRQKSKNFNNQAIWALKDVSFEVKRGDVLGIIGRNGAGKSTLLKILSRITKPTQGRAEICGGVGSLLEVGTGFHEELTGRENIYFNGSILGLKKLEIDRNFDQIVDFAEIGRFLDTPVKYYSSGMYVRLAFAIAAHLEPQVLLIDEILAVGDIGFQRKCFNKISNVSGAGRTILIVSHNMSVINALCSKAILLDSGKVIASGEKEYVVDRYLDIVYGLMDAELSRRSDRKGSGHMRFVKYWLENCKGERVRVFRSGEDAVICAEYNSSGGHELHSVSAAFALKDYLGNQVTDLANRISSEPWEKIPPNGVMRCKMHRLPLMPGMYRFNLFAQVKGAISDHIIDAGKFEVEAGIFFKTGKLLDAGQGNILMDNSWSVS